MTKIWIVRKYDLEEDYNSLKSAKRYKISEYQLINIIEFVNAKQNVKCYEIVMNHKSTIRCKNPKMIVNWNLMDNLCRW